MDKQETAVLIGICTVADTPAIVKEHLDELEFLAETAGVITLKRFTQNLNQKHPKYFVGTGKLTEIKNFVEENEIDIVIFDDELTPSQLRNIENVLTCKILDRTNLILDIFAGRAKTAQARAQVDLAQCEYLLPRLTRLWTHLSKQKGGVGMKGPGETEIETDRRAIRTKISLLKEKLKKISIQAKTQRANRGQKVRVALVGYTNVGKSTIMNILSKETLLAENKLFATLDTTVRKIMLGSYPVLLSDTVGFIRKLPHNLVESFKSTLDEALEADILLHVVDISHHDYENQMQVVHDTLTSLGVKDKKIITVYNKADNYIVMDEDKIIDLSPEEKIKYLENTFLSNNEDAIFISAFLKLNIGKFKQLLEADVKDCYKRIYPYALQQTDVELS